MVLDQLFGGLLLECLQEVIDFLQVVVEHQILLNLLLVDLVEQVAVVQVLVIQVELHQLLELIQELQTPVVAAVAQVQVEDILLIVVQEVQV